MLTENTNVKIIVGADQSEITAKVENVEKYGDDYVAVFSADDLNSTIASSRVGRFKLLVDSYNGILHRRYTSIRITKSVCISRAAHRHSL